MGVVFVVFGSLCKNEENTEMCGIYSSREEAKKEAKRLEFAYRDIWIEEHGVKDV